MMKFYQLALGCLAATIAAAALWLGGGSLEAADPLPQPNSRHELETISGSYAPQLATSTAGRLSPAAPNPIAGIDCAYHCPPGYEATWKALGPVAGFQEWAQGEYVGRARLPHVPVYRLRVDDAVEFVFRVDRDRIPGQYKLNVGDELTIESPNDSTLQRTLTVLPDGTISLPMVGEVEAAGRTVTQLRDELVDRFKQYYNDPVIGITPTRINSQLEELRFAIAGRSGFGGQTLPGPISPSGTTPSGANPVADEGLARSAQQRDASLAASARLARAAEQQTPAAAVRSQVGIRVTPEGTITLPAVGPVPAQGLTLDEFKLELDERYGERIEGMEVVPVLRQHGPRFVYILGEVRQPGRYELVAPTTLMQAITMAGSWTVGAHLTNVVVFRRADDWRLMATTVDLRAAFAGKRPCPGGDIWIGDSDLIIVPKAKIERFGNFVDLVFTRGVYGVLPVGFGTGYSVFRGILPFLPAVGP